MEKFSYEANGYNRQEVNQFVSDVVEEFKDQGFVSRKKQIVPRLAQELA